MPSVATFFLLFLDKIETIATNKTNQNSVSVLSVATFFLLFPKNVSVLSVAIFLKDFSYSSNTYTITITTTEPLKNSAQKNSSPYTKQTQ